MAAEPLRTFAADLHPPVRYRCWGLVILTLSFASWTALFAGTRILLRLF